MLEINLEIPDQNIDTEGVNQPRPRERAWWLTRPS